MQIENLIDQIEAAGLTQVKFKRKTTTGMHKFVDTRTDEEYVTYNNGYVRRTNNYSTASITPINKKKITKHPIYPRAVSTFVLLDTEEKRLELLLKYMKGKNKRFAKYGTKWFGQPEPKWGPSTYGK